MHPLMYCVVSAHSAQSCTIALCVCLHVHVCRLVSPLSLDEFGWSKIESTLYNNIMFVCSAFVAIATFVAIKFISKV